jgi:stage II sporulation protein D
MTRYTKRTYSRMVLLSFLLIAIISGSIPLTAHAAIDVPNSIRVALFVNLGANKYQSLASSATMTSADGMNLTWRSSEFNLPAGNVAAGQAVRFAVDGYRAIVLETAELNAAIVVLKKLQASTSAAFVTRLSKAGQVVYQVSEGVYSSAAGASTALAKWTSAGVATGIATKAKARIAGPWAVEAGPYASAAEATSAAALIGSKGMDAFVALKPHEGALSYFVRVGQEVDSSTLGALQQAVSAAGGLNARIPAAEEAYAIVREDMTYNGSANKPISLYAIPVIEGTTLRADPVGASGIQVAERYKRTYRGSMEISTLNQSLAVVNEVDFEQYLYSVVAVEVGPSWPLEAQKAQAVAARSYALSSGLGYQIAHVVDTTSSQAYYGIEHENVNSTNGVMATSGEVLTMAGKVINAVFSANAGGTTADNAIEIWGGDNSFLSTSVSSPDSGPQQGKNDWYYVALPSGVVGYIRADLLVDSGQLHSTGAKLLKVTAEGTAVRVSPQVDAAVEPIARVGSGDHVIQLDQVAEYTAYSWVEAPMTPEQLLTAINKRAKTKIDGPLKTLEVTKRGPSDRVIEIKANGIVVDVGASDNLRGALNGLRSTLFYVEETGRYTVLGANGKQREIPANNGELQVIEGNGTKVSLTDDTIYVLDGKGKLRAGTTAPMFVFSGKGYGHGLGLSQWGARGLAEQGYDYQYILKYYYNNVSIEKDVQP